MQSAHPNPLALAGWSSLESWFVERAGQLSVPHASLAVQTPQGVKACYHSDAAAQFDALVPVGCITKAFTAHLVLDLVRRGALSLHDSARDFVSELHGFDPDICIGHLLAHTSGLFFRGEMRLAMDPASLSWTVNASPGDVYHYSQFNYALLTRVLETVLGMQWAEAVDQYVLAPLDCGLQMAPATEHASLAETAAREMCYRGAWSEVLGMDVETLCRYGFAHVDSKSGSRELGWISAQMRSCPDWHPRFGATDVLGFSFKHLSSGPYFQYGTAGPRKLLLVIYPDEGALAISVTGNNSFFPELLARIGLYLGATVTVASATRGSVAPSLAACEGQFELDGTSIAIGQSEGRLWATMSDHWHVSVANKTAELSAISGRLFLARFAIPMNVEFIGDAYTRQYQYLRFGESIFSRSRECPC